MNVKEIVQRIEGLTGKEARRSDCGYSLRCPSHDDGEPSLSVSEGADGRVLVHCFAGCSAEQICNAIEIDMSELFPEKTGLESFRTEYIYRDEQGQEVFSKIRVEPGFNGKTKSFYFERLDDKGEIVRNIKGCRRVLYRLPEVIEGIKEGKTVFLVEGEKDADFLARLGLVATTSAESLVWLEEFTQVLKAADVALLFDMDKTGYDRRDLIIKNLYGRVKRLRVVTLPGLIYQDSHGQDVTDWLKIGHTSQELLQIMEKTEEYSSKEEVNCQVRVVTLEEFLHMELPKREMMLSPFLPTQGLCLLYAKRGVGKTHVALGIAYAVAIGGEFLKWKAPRPRKTLFIDGEMPAVLMQERLRRIVASGKNDMPSPQYLRLVTPDLQTGAMPDLSTKQGRLLIDKLVHDSELIIVDNVSSLFRSGIENEAESWQSVQDWALEIRRSGKSILFVHHAGKSGLQRGTSKREDILDSVINLKHPEGYKADKGAQFEVIFEKTRHFAGVEAESFHVELIEGEDDLWTWKITEVAIDFDLEEVATLVNEGKTIRQIGEELGLTKSQVETRKKKAKEAGLLSA